MAREELAAVCGLYCGACVIYRACHDNNQQRLKEVYEDISSRQQATPDDVYCDGCLGGGRLTTYCRQCEIRLCPKIRRGTRCSDCLDFPCSRISAFNSDGVRHHAEVLDSLRRMREIGVSAWVEEQERRWRCPECGKAVEWYSRPCFHCGAEQPRRLPSLPRDKK